MLLCLDVIFGNIVNKAIYGDIVNMMLKIIKHPIYNTNVTLYAWKKKDLV